MSGPPQYGLVYRLIVVGHKEGREDVVLHWMGMKRLSFYPKCLDAVMSCTCYRIAYKIRIKISNMQEK